MRERNFDTSLENFSLANALQLWKKWPDSDSSTANLAKLLSDVTKREPVQITLRKEVLDNSRTHKFRTKHQALELGHIDGRHLIFDIDANDTKTNRERRVSARIDKINGESFLILETPADKPFGFLRPEDIVSIRI